MSRIMPILATEYTAEFEGEESLEVNILIQLHYPPRVQHPPQKSCLYPQRQPNQIIHLPVMCSLRKEKPRPHQRNPSKCRLQVENYPPGFKCDDYTTYKRTKCRSDEGSGEEPSHGCSPLGRSVDIT